MEVGRAGRVSSVFVQKRYMCSVGGWGWWGLYSPSGDIQVH